MMGRLESGQGKFFYDFCLDDHESSDHLLLRIEAVLDLGWLRAESSPFYSSLGRPSVDPELMVRRLRPNKLKGLGESLVPCSCQRPEFVMAVHPRHRPG